MYSEKKDESMARTRRRGLSSWQGGLFAAMLLVAVVAVTAACSSSDQGSSSGQGDQQQGTTNSEETTSSSPVEAVQLAYKNTTEAKTAKVDLNASFSLPNGSTTASSSGQQQAGMDMNMTGQGVIDFENKMADLTMQSPIGDIEARQIGNTVYYKLPEQLTQQKADQKPWIKLDLDAMAQQQFGTSFSGLQGAGSSAATDPTQQLGYLQGISDSVEEVGTEEVRGTPSTHYKANIDLQKAAAQQESTTQQEGTQLRQAYDQIEQQLGTSTLPVDVWLDDQGRIVRFEMSLPVPVPASTSSQQNANQQGGGGQQGQVSISEELYDFGTPVSVQAPPEDQTSEMTDLAAQQKGK